MTIRRISLEIDEYYHLYSRGVDKRSIFVDSEDKKRFVRLLYLCNSSIPIVYKTTKGLSLPSINKGVSITAIGAYCLMPNHFHILVKESKDGGITKFMSKLLTAYSSYFNRKYRRTGALFESEFKSSHIDSDVYLKYIYAYIHLNPLKLLEPDWKDKGLERARAESFLEHYQDSSYLDYAGEEREEACILNRLTFPEYFLSHNDFKVDLFDWYINPEVIQGEGLDDWG